MMRSGMTRDVGKRLREFAGWFMDPPTLSRRVTVSLTLEELRSLRSYLDRAAFLAEKYADVLAREEGKALAEVESPPGRTAHAERALAFANALLDKDWVDG